MPTPSSIPPDSSPSSIPPSIRNTIYPEASDEARSAQTQAQRVADSSMPPDSSYRLIFQGREPHKKEWRRFLSVDPSLRTWVSGAMTYVEKTIEFLKRLDVEDLTKEFQDKLRFIGPALEEIVQDLRSPHFDNGSLSLLGAERIQNLLFRDGKGSMFRLNINLTDANKIDPSGNLGTAFKYAVLEWLQDEFGIKHIMLSPEGSSFLAINVSRHEMSSSLGRFEREIRYRLMLPEMRERFEYDASLMGEFIPSAVGLFMTITDEGLNIQKILGDKNTKAIHRLQSRVIKRIADSLRLLAVGCTFAERDPSSIGLKAGLAVYDVTDLPSKPKDKGYMIFQEQLKLGLGYVPPSIYRSEFLDTTVATDNKMMAAYPRMSHDFGHLDRPPREGDKGGALQILVNAIDEASRASDDEQKKSALKKLRKAASRFARALDLGRIASLNPRNHMFNKWLQEIRLSDGTNLVDSYFIENAALRPESKIHLVLLELDSFKAFSSSYPVDEYDTDFWAVFDHVFAVADALSIDKPSITQVAGDLVAAAVPTVDSNGDNVDIKFFVRMVQRRITDSYMNRPFQDYSKVEISNGDEKGTRVERWPLWQRGKEVFPAQEKPMGSRPYMNTLSVSAVATTISTPKEGQDLKTYSRIIEEMAKNVEELKIETSPKKGGFLYFEERELAPTEPPGPSSVPTSIGDLHRAFERSGPKASIIKKFESSIDEQLYEAWGERWRWFDKKFRDELIGCLVKSEPNLAPILTSGEFMGVISTMQCGKFMQFLDVPFLFVPPLTVGV